MSKKRKAKFGLKHLLIIIVILACLIAGYFIFQNFLKPTFVSEQPSQPSSNPITDITPEKTEPETPSGEPKNEDFKTPVQNEGENPNESESLSGFITTSRVSGDQLIIRVSIDQYLSSGTCKIKLNSGSNSYSEQVAIVSAASTSTCEGFNIPLSKLSSGSWNFEIKLFSDSKEGIITGEVEI